MNKKVLINQLFGMVCALAENIDIQYNVGAKLLEKALHNDISYLEELPDRVTNDFQEIHTQIFHLLNLLNEKEIKIISENIYIEIFQMLENIDIAYNTNLSYIERGRGKYIATLKQIHVNVLLEYISEGKNLLNLYKAFRADYEEYAKAYMGPISSIADTSNSSQLNAVIQKRKIAEENLLKKYKDLNITHFDLRTPLEDEMALREISRVV